MQIISSYQLQQGFTADRKDTILSTIPALIQPVQALPNEEKDDAWRVWNMDWYEWQGLRQIRSRIHRLAKNYRLANGVIDKSDYTPEVDDPNKHLIDILSREEDINEISEIKFFPLIPPIIDLFVGEFAKRVNKVFPVAIDPASISEKLEKKKELVNNYLIAQTQQEIAEKLISMGVEPDSEEFTQNVSRENIMNLPEIQKFISKNYKINVEEWAAHQINADRQRFKMDELEIYGFRDSLITDMEFWHIYLGENDYYPEIWNPLYTFYHKSPNKRYISESNFVGFTELLTVSDVVDKYGYLMTEDELLSLEKIYPHVNVNFLLPGQNDGRYYDVTRSVDENQRTGSLNYKQYLAWEMSFGAGNTTGMFDWVLQDDENTLLNRYMLRVTTCYWKSLRKYYWLTKVDDVGNLTSRIVGENYIAVEKPLYDNTFYKENTRENLIYGEHLEPLWAPEVWGGVKIGANMNTFGFQFNPNGLQPIYLGLAGKKKPDRLPFQFRGNDSVYGARIPVEGARFSERNSKSRSLVDRLVPYQIPYNIVNNQIQDIIIDEQGTIVVLDQNTLPKHSMGEDWGPNNLAKAYVAMKDFSILPLDYSMENTESPIRFNQLTQLDLSQTQRLLGRIQLANYFRTEGYTSIGVTQQRVGSVTSQETATGTQVAINNSYAQTEKYFIQHSDFLMPRVYELMINAAQYYKSTNPSEALSYITEKGEEVIYEMYGTDILPRLINVHCTTSFALREIKNKLEALAVENNTTGATLADLGKVIQASTPSEIIEAMNEVDQRLAQQAQAQRDHEAQLEQMRLKAEEEADLRNKQFEASENQKDREAGIIEKQIQAHAKPANTDVYDPEPALNRMQTDRQFAEKMSLDREKELSRQMLEREKLNVKREELQTKKEIANTQFKIAKENKQKSDKKK